MNIDLRAVLQRALDEYENAGRPAVVISSEHESDPETVRLSQLVSCELAHGLSKNRIPHTNPETLNYHMFRVGESVAEIFQKAMIFHAQNHTGIAASAEQSVHVPGIGGLGRYDLLLTYQEIDPLDGDVYDDKVVIEIKNTEGFIKRSIGEPRDSYALQTIAYIMGMQDQGVKHGAIVTASKWAWQVYYVVPVDYLNLEAGFVVNDEYGNRYEPNYGTDWNTPEYLSFNTIRERAEVMHDIMGQVAVWQDQPELFPEPINFRPIDNPLNTDRQIWCTRVADKGKKTDRGGTPPRPKTVVPSCEYFDICWPNAVRNDSDTINVEVVDDIEYMEGYIPTTD